MCAVANADAESGVCQAPSRPQGSFASVSGVRLNGISKKQFTSSFKQAYLDALVTRIEGAREAFIVRVYQSQETATGRRLQSRSSSSVVVDTEVVFESDVSEA